jgi:ATP-dependent DNA helicase RecQ
MLGYGDLRKVRYFIQQKDEHEQVVANVLLNALVGFAETDLCRRIPLLGYFGETDLPADCGMCDNCRMEKKETEDITIPAQMFLSCVKRTGERFGAGHVIDVLRGSNARKILTFGHESLSTYGIGTAYSAGQWRHLSRQFLQRGLLIQETEHGALRLTPKAWEVMKGRETVRGRLEEGVVRPKPRVDEGGEYDPDLFDLLRKRRKEIADGRHLPPFAIFHDRTLREMAASFPMTREELAEVYGIGAAKLEKYGETFLEIIRQYRP